MRILATIISTRDGNIKIGDIDVKFDVELKPYTDEIDQNHHLGRDVSYVLRFSFDSRLVTEDMPRYIRGVGSEVYSLVELKNMILEERRERMLSKFCLS